MAYDRRFFAGRQSARSRSRMNEMFSFRAMQARDIPAVMSIQAQAYAPPLHEEEAVVRSRLAACPQQAWVAEDAQGVCAYLFAYPSRLGQVTPLDGDFQPHTEADCLYLHDLAVARRAAGRGIGPALVKHKLQRAGAAKLRYSALVSVQDSQGFWSRLGFRPEVKLAAPQADNLASYRIPAVYMVRRLDTEATKQSR